MQNYHNHRQLNPMHHFFLLPLTFIILVWTIVKVFTEENTLSEKMYFFAIAIAFVLLTLISRKYAIKNQDRIIRVEMRLRYFELTGKSFSDREKELTQGQIIALRFAGNNEFLALIDKAVTEKLTSKDIKLSITDWQADKKRV